MASVSAFLAFAFCLLPCAFLVLAQSPPQAPQFRAGVDLFEFEVTVLDRNRQPVRGLTQADFSILENGKPQPIVGFSEVEFAAGDGPISTAVEEVAPDVSQRRYADRRLIAVVMDDFGMPGDATNFQMVSQAKNVGKQIIDSLGPQDFAAIVLSRDTRFFADFTNDRWKLMGAVNEFKPPEGAERNYLAVATNGHIGGLPALMDITDQLAKLPQHRKVIIYVSIGQGGRYLAGMTMDRTRDVIRAAQEAGISISTIDPAGLMIGGNLGTSLLKTLADNTGGSAYTGGNDPVSIVPQIFEETRSYYLIGYQQTGPADGKFRKIDVRLNRTGLTVLARTGHPAPGKPDMVKAAPLPVDEAVDDAIAGLARATERRVSTYAVSRAGGINVVAEIGNADAGASAWLHGADVDVRITRGAGEQVATARGRLADGERASLVAVTLPPAASSSPGSDAAASRPAPLHVSVKISAGGESLEDGSDVLGSGTVLGDPIVFRGVASPRVPLRPVAGFQFARTERLHVEFPELGAMTERKVRLLRKNGEALTITPELSERQADDRTTLIADQNLSFLAPGDYVLELFVRSGPAADRKLVAFRVR